MTSVVPKIPKMDVEDLLMLEAPKPPPVPKPTKEPKYDKLRTASTLDIPRPLPPISIDTDRAQTQIPSDILGEFNTNATTAKGPIPQDQDAFFLTQVRVTKVTDGFNQIHKIECFMKVCLKMLTVNNSEERIKVLFLKNINQILLHRM